MKVPARIGLLVAGHITMLALMRHVLVTYEPEPNGFRLDDLKEILAFAVFTSLPLIIGVVARTIPTVAIVAALQAASPLALVPTARDPSEDLDFAMLLWWFPLPALAVGVLASEAIITRRNRY